MVDLILKTEQISRKRISRNFHELTQVCSKPLLQKDICLLT